MRATTIFITNALIAGGYAVAFLVATNPLLAYLRHHAESGRVLYGALVRSGTARYWTDHLDSKAFGPAVGLTSITRDVFHQDVTFYSRLMTLRKNQIEDWRFSASFVVCMPQIGLTESRRP